MTTKFASNRLAPSLVDASLSLGLDESRAATGADIITVRQNANVVIGHLTSFTVDLLFGHHLTECSAIFVPSPTDIEERPYRVCSEKCPSRLDESIATASMADWSGVEILGRRIRHWERSQRVQNGSSDIPGGKKLSSAAKNCRFPIRQRHSYKAAKLLSDFEERIPRPSSRYSRVRSRPYQATIGWRAGNLIQAVVRIFFIGGVY